MTRAVIGITLGDGDRPGYHSMRADYVRSVERSGAVPVVLPSLAPEHAEALLDRLDGLLLSGGVDVDPALYGRPRHPKLGRVDRERDEFELALTRHALRRDLPILAICRGQQVLNVADRGNADPGPRVRIRGGGDARGTGPADAPVTPRRSGWRGRSSARSSGRVRFQ